MLNYHLVILKKYYLDKILDGSKRVELRLTKTAVPPFGCSAAGDILVLKESSGPVCAVAQVSAVKQVSNLTPVKIAQLKTQYNHLICGADAYWQFKSDSQFAVLLWLKNVKSIAPVRIYKKDWRAWVVLKKPYDYGLIDILASSGNIIKQADRHNINQKA
ncbi:MAG: ASCH domain-containing protein [Sedimentisphaerales bacterium]